MASEKEIQIFRQMIEKWVDQDRAKRLIREARTITEPIEIKKKETLVERIQREWSELEAWLREWVMEEDRIEKEKWDKWVIERTWEAISEFGTEKKFELEAAKPWETLWWRFRRESQNLLKLWGNIWTDILQIWWDTADFIWETIDRPWEKLESAKTLWEWVLWFFMKAGRLWRELWIWEDIERSEQEKIADAIWKWIASEVKDKFWTMDKARETITQNPLDTFLVLRWALSGLKKADVNQEKVNELTRESDQAIEQFLKPTKKETKQLTKKITPEIRARLSDGRLKPGDREVIKQVTDANVERVWDELDKFIQAWKVKWDIDFDWMINVLAKADSDARVNWNIIPWREAEVKFINTQLDFLWRLQDVYKWKLPASKQLELRRKYDIVFDKAVTRDKITKFQDELQLKLADSLRSELAKNNPELDKINKEISFNLWLQKVLDETLDRTTWQDPVWLMTELRKASQWTAWAAVGAAAWWTAAWPIWAAVWAVIWWAIWAKLTKVLASPKYRLVDAKKKAQLADAIAKWDATKVEKILDWLTISLGISVANEEE